MKDNKSGIQKVISSIFAFLLSLLFVACIILLGLYFGVFNDRIIISKVSESNFYNEVHQELKDKAETILRKSRLPNSVLEEVITLERVYIGGKYYIEDTLSGTEAVINTDRLRENLAQNIDEYLIEEEITPTAELDTGVSEIISEIEQEYKRGIQFKFIKYITEYKAYYRELLSIGVPILVVLIGMLSYLLIRMQKYKHRGIRYITYAMMSSTGMTILTATFLLLTKSYNKMEVSPEYYDRFLTNYLRWDIQVFLYLGGMGVLISILLMTLVSYVKIKTIRDRK